MIKIDIHGMKDGEFKINLNTKISEIECLFEEFFGNIDLNGTIKKIGNRFTLISKAEVMVRLTCDRSLKIYEEKISCDVNLAFIADTKAFLESTERDIDSDILIREDAQFIDITSEVIELLALNLPMKRIAPEYRDKDITEIFPEISDGINVTDERWAKLKDFKIN